MNVSDASRIVNTFDAHRLIAWAGNRGRQADMEHQLLLLHFTDQCDVSDHAILAGAAAAIGLDGDEARAMLVSDAYRSEVRREEQRWRERGIDSVPAVVIDDRYLISGGQPPEEFERQLRAIAASRPDGAHG